MTRALCALALLALGCKPLPVVTPLPDPIVYPRVASYSWLRGNGAPLVRMDTAWVIPIRMRRADVFYPVVDVTPESLRALRESTPDSVNLWVEGPLYVRTIGPVIDTAAVRAQARYDVVVIDPYRSGMNAAALRLLRSEMTKRRGTLMLAFVGTSKFFVCGPGWYGGDLISGCDTTQIAFSRFRAVQHFDGLLMGKNGPYLGGGWIDFGKPGLAEALADTAVAWMPAGWQGIFSDESCLGIGWSQSYGDSINFRRSGFSTMQAWEAAYQAGVERYFARLRERLGARLIVGNCGPVGSRIANGWMIENLPYQNGGTVAAYLERETTYTAPRLNWLSAWAVNGDTANAENKRKARFALGTACMGSGVGVITYSPTDVARGTFLWLPEYEPRGWPGQPKGAAYRQADGTWRRDFSGGSVIVNERAEDATFIRRR